MLRLFFCICGISFAVNPPFKNQAYNSWEGRSALTVYGGEINFCILFSIIFFVNYTKVSFSAF